MAPEQLRHATSEERSVLATPDAGLLGIKDLIDKGQLKSQQFVDLLPPSYPTQSELPELPSNAEVAQPDGDNASEPPVPSVPVETSEDLADMSDQPVKSETGQQSEVPLPAVVDHPEDAVMPPLVEPSQPASTGSAGANSESSYDPVRFRRVSGKDGPHSL